MLTPAWQKNAERIANEWVEEPTSSIAQMVLEESFEGEPQGNEVELAYHEIRAWLVTYMACNPDT